MEANLKRMAKIAAPIIAISGPRHGAWMVRHLVALAVLRGGGCARQVRPGNKHPLTDVAGVIITGGHDIDPVLYAAAPEVVPNYDQERDHFEAALIDEALARQLPLLGICRGAQLLNVSLGGSLFQDLRPRRRRTSNRRTILPLKTLQLTPETQLAHWFATPKTRINSLHNQGIDRLGQGLRVSGRDLDGIVQAIEDPSQRFLIGVQWHPEFLLYLTRQQALFTHLVVTAKITRQNFL